MKKSLANNPMPRQSRPRLTLPVKVIGSLVLMSLAAGAGLLAPRPARTAGGPVAVTVSNVPLPTKPADVAPTQPFQADTFYIFANGSSGGFLDTADGYADIVVPAGKRLIVQSVGVYENAAAGQTLQAYLLTTISGRQEYYALPSVPDNGTSFPGATQSLTLSSDAGPLTWSVYRKGTAGRSYVRLTICGYLVDA